MQTILGAGGAIGKELAKSLTAYTDHVRLVSRGPAPVTGKEELFAADLLDAGQTLAAVGQSDVVYLTAGLPYHNSTWESNWPMLMDNVIAACTQYRTKLVFFDNVYMYDPDRLDGMTEATPVNPRTRKGKVRQRIAQKVLEAHKRGELQALIARSADFYGPAVENSVLNDLIVKKLKAGQRPQWLCDAHQPHNFTYTPDAGRATAQLGNDETAYGRVWHLPTTKEALTATEWAARFAPAFDRVTHRPFVMPGWGVKALGLAMPQLAALHEMLYQYDRPYRFDSSAFEARYGWAATDIQKCVEEIAAG